MSLVAWAHCESHAVLCSAHDLPGARPQADLLPTRANRRNSDSPQPDPSTRSSFTSATASSAPGPAVGPAVDSAVDLQLGPILGITSTARWPRQRESQGLRRGDTSLGEWVARLTGRDRAWVRWGHTATTAATGPQNRSSMKRRSNEQP
jgi:hypothetical protein